MPRDKRPYVVVTDEMPDHPKIEALSDKAFRTLVTLWCRSHRLDTNGRVSAVQWRRVPAKVRAELVAAPLVIEHEDGSAEMRDYLDHNQSSEEREAGREKKRQAGAKGGAAKAAAVAGAKAGAVAPASDVLEHLPSTDVAEGRGKREEKKTSSSSGRKRPATPLPDGFTVTPEMLAWGRAQKLTVDPHRETAKFIGHAQANDRRQVDWVAAWRTWMLKAEEGFGGQHLRVVTEADHLPESLRGFL